MRLEEIKVGDLVLLQNCELEVLTIAKVNPSKGSSPYILFCCDENDEKCKNDCFSTDAFYIDDDFIQRNFRFSVPEKFLGWKACYLKPDEISKLSYRPKLIGEVVNLSCTIENGVIKKLNKPNFPGTVVQEFEIIGRRFDKYSWQYEYAIKISNSPVGEEILEIDIKRFEMEPNMIGSSYFEVFACDLVSSSPNISIGKNCMNLYCKEFCPWVEEFNCPNDVFLCYSCRSNPITYSMVMSKFEKNV